MKAENEKEFLALIKKYESITLKEVERTPEGRTMYSTINSITGFGSIRGCTLCLAARLECRVNCTVCVYGILQKEATACYKGENGDTYQSIEDAEDPEQLLSAIKARAKHMKKVYRQYKKQL